MSAESIYVDATAESWRETPYVGIAWKKLLFEKMMETLGPIRWRWEDLRKRFDDVEDIFREGAKRARAVAQKTVADCRRAAGVDHS